MRVQESVAEECILRGSCVYVLKSRRRTEVTFGRDAVQLTDPPGSVAAAPSRKESVGPKNVQRHCKQYILGVVEERADRTLYDWAGKSG